MAEIDQIVSRPAAGLNILDDRSLLRLIWLLLLVPYVGLLWVPLYNACAALTGLVYHSGAMTSDVDSVVLAFFVAFFLLVTVMGFVAVRWRHPTTLARLDEWGLGGRQIGTWITWLLVGSNFYTAYTVIAVPALVYAAGAYAVYSRRFAHVSRRLAAISARSRRTVLRGGLKRRPQACKPQVCDHGGGRFAMVMHRWWGNKFCKRTCKNAYLREHHHTLSGWVIPQFFRFAGGACLAAAVAVAVLTLLLASANTAPAAEQPAAGASLEFNKEDGTLYIDWSGPIVAGMADDLRAALDNYSMLLDRVVLFLDSAGGRVDDGDRVIAVLNEIKLRHQLITVVPHGKLCASMCIPIFLQGEDRLAARASLWLFHEAAQRQANGILRTDTAETWRLFRKYYRDHIGGRSSACAERAVFTDLPFAFDDRRIGKRSELDACCVFRHWAGVMPICLLNARWNAASD
jgi:hypothetical protein